MSERRREKQENTRQELLRAALELLMTHSVDAVCSQITPSRLAAHSDRGPSADTAYRLMGNPARVLELVAEAVGDTGFSAPDLGWPAMAEVTAEATDAFASSEDPLARATAAFERYVRGNFEVSSRIVGLMLDAAAVTASPLWAGPVSVRPEQAELARRVLEARQRTLRSMTAELRWVLHDGMSALQRRPRPGYSLDLILALAHSLIDGAVIQMLIDPERMTIAELTDAAFLFAMALTEDGSMVDPRLPPAGPSRSMFTALVDEADRRWSADRAPLDPAMVAEAVECPQELADLLFPRVADLADSVVRRRTIAAGSTDGPPIAAQHVLKAALHRLAEAAETIPHVIALTATLPEGSVLADLSAFASSVAAQADSPPDDPDNFGAQLVALAMSGLAQWGAVELLLDLL